MSAIRYKLNPGDGASQFKGQVRRGAYVFWWNSIIKTLPHGTTEQVLQEVRARVELLGRGGGRWPICLPGKLAIFLDFGKG